MSCHHRASRPRRGDRTVRSRDVSATRPGASLPGLVSCPQLGLVRQLSWFDGGRFAEGHSITCHAVLCPVSRPISAPHPSPDSSLT